MVADLSLQLIGLCARYLVDVKNAEDDRVRLSNEVTCLYETVSRIQGLLDGPHGPRLKASQQLRL